jgi:hypothetical protein
MVLLAAGLVVVGVLCLLDLVLTLGVVRRLREHTTMLSAGGWGGEEAPIGLTAGEMPAGFAAVTADGAQITGPADLSVVAFFSTSCSLCPKRVPAFVNYVRSGSVRPQEVLAIVTGDNGESVPYYPDLAAVGQVAAEPDNGPANEAFGVTGFPAFFVLGAGGVVVASGYDPARLPVPAKA